MLLWSHYGDQHRGICIGYTLDRRPKPDLRQVRYGGDRTIATSLLEQALLEKQREAIERLDIDVLLREAPEWAYENEWRLIDKVGLRPVWDLYPNADTAVLTAYVFLGPCHQKPRRRPLRSS